MTTKKQSYPVVQTVQHEPFVLSPKFLKQCETNLWVFCGYRVLKSTVRRILTTDYELIVAVTTRYGGKRFYRGYTDGGCLIIGCKKFSIHATRKIKKWAFAEKKASRRKG